jgi:hypothetical protein
LYDLLPNLINNIDDADVFFVLMDSVVHLMMNESLIADRDKIKEIGKVMFERATKFSSHRKVQDWLGWAEVYLCNAQRDDRFGLDTNTSTIIHISKDKLVLRHEFWGTFGSAIAERSVSKGKWYYECELLTTGLFFVGWVNKEFKPQPYEGIGVGSDEHSWAVDLKKHTIRHINKNGSVRLPYAKDASPDVGGVIQCYLDLDSGIMSFGYNGTNYGPAFDDFDISGGLYAAVSTNLENECRLNFGSTPFRYPPTDYLPLCECVKS